MAMTGLAKGPLSMKILEGSSKVIVSRNPAEQGLVRIKNKNKKGKKRKLDFFIEPPIPYF
jgi:hypothetical protein